MKRVSRNHFFLYKIYSEASERLYLNLSLAWCSTFQLVQGWHEPYYKWYKQCFTVIWFDLLSGKYMEYVNVHEVCLCEKKKGDKVRINSGH